ncbi:MFS transporter [Lipingzhangella sp. LS1_29]|uniref:MFS transporter n=1 Tax=Lipingzhangella rawalii TaxID=2055835 RepID=A0ABU2H3I6_9ACTN|nr:MFS transporter [Lipingzhangella rawalii]MDS1269861.1 MFS transporter [Lipingzhangella rawalii]
MPRMGRPPAAGITGRESAPYGWTPLVVLFFVGLVDRIETYIASGALPFLQEEWGFSDTMGGMIMTAPLIVGAIMLVPAGYLSDRANRTGLIAAVVAVWSLLMLGSALAPVFLFFFITRVLLGAADTIDNPASGSLLADYYPPRTRAKAFGWVRLTNFAGVALGSLLGAVVAELFGWRWAFACMVIPGLIVAVLCWRLREPLRGFLDQVIARNPSQPVTEEELGQDRSMSARPGMTFPQQFGHIWRIPTLRLVSVGLALLTLGLTGIFWWIPSLAVRTFGITESQGGLINAFVILVGVVSGAIFGSYLGTRWHWTRVAGRLLAGGLAILLGSVLLIPTLAMTTVPTFVALLTASCFVMAIAIPNLYASIADVVSATSRGVGFAVLNFFIIGGSAAGPLVIGAISDMTGGSLVAGMYSLVPLMALGGGLVLGARRHFGDDAERVLAQAGQPATR